MLQLDKHTEQKIISSLHRFVQWLDVYGETSYDFHSFYAGPLGSGAKKLYYRNALLGTIAVAPMIFCEAFAPSARRLFWHRQRFPIADAHYAMGFSRLSQVTGERKHFERALHFLGILEQTRCKGYEHYCWGYPYDWVTKNGTIAAGTPLITTTPYVYEAFAEVYEIDKNERWREIMHSIVEHAMHDIKGFDVFDEASMSSYTPHDRGGVINASAYRAFLLTSASIHFSDDKYLQTALRNLNFVLQAQEPDGSWYYEIGGQRNFIDHFHTCFVLKALAKIERLTGHEGCSRAIERGIHFYVKNLFDGEGLPKPFSKAPRLTVYRRELYNYAECINLGILLNGRFEELDRAVLAALQDLLHRWQKPDGSFRSRQLLFGWDNVPMHRWAQAQLFRSLGFLLYQYTKEAESLSGV